MYIQHGGNVIWDNGSWKAKPGQEYSVMEKDLLIMLNAIPIPDSIITRGKNKGRVKNLSSWWENPHQKEPMTKSLFDIISSIDGYSLPEINLKLKEIIDRRTQDADKLETISTSESIKGHHITYLESLKQAKKFIQAVYTDFIKNRHNTHEHIISPHRINATDTRDVAIRLSHDAPEFVPTLNIDAQEFVPNTTIDTALQEAVYSQPVYSQPLYPAQHGVIPNISPIILQYNPLIGRFYTLNTSTNEITYIN